MPVAWDVSYKPTILYDLEYHDMYFVDTDFFTSLSPEMNPGPEINTNAGKVWGNLWAWAIAEVKNPSGVLEIP